MALFQVFNGAMPTTSCVVKVSTGTAIKTLMQIQPSATAGLKIVEWGVSFDGAGAAAGIQCELIQTDVAATVTAYVQADIMTLDAEAIAFGNVTTNLIQVGTANSGYTGSAEGSTTVARVFDTQIVQPTGQYVKQFPLGREPYIQVSKFARIRVTAAAAVNATCYMTLMI